MECEIQLAAYIKLNIFMMHILAFLTLMKFNIGNWYGHILHRACYMLLYLTKTWTLP